MLPVVVYTNHSAAVLISRQTSLTTSSTNKLNLRLIRASQYLLMFDLSVRYKAGKTNIVLNALSRLLGNTTVTNLDPRELKALNADLLISYYVTLVEILDNFKSRLIATYANDQQQNKVLNILQRVIRNASQESTAQEEAPTAIITSQSADDDATTRHIRLRFKLRDGLIFYTNFNDGRERLCIPNTLKKEVFELAHNRQHHRGFHRTYDRIVSSIFIRHLTSHLRTYIDHYPEYKLNQTKRHKPYDNIIPINKPGISFYTIAIDFIVALPLTAEGYNYLLTVTNKFSKRVLLIPGKINYNASDWANLLLAKLIEQEQGIPQTIISNRDSKFMSDFWSAIFKKFRIDLLALTAYHPQTDKQSERTN